MGLGLPLTAVLRVLQSPERTWGLEGVAPASQGPWCHCSSDTDGPLLSSTALQGAPEEVSGAGGTGLGAEGMEQWPGRGLWLLEPGSS